MRSSRADVLRNKVTLPGRIGARRLAREWGLRTQPLRVRVPRRAPGRRVLEGAATEQTSISADKSVRQRGRVVHDETGGRRPPRRCGALGRRGPAGQQVHVAGRPGAHPPCNAATVRRFAGAPGTPTTHEHGVRARPRGSATVTSRHQRRRLPRRGPPPRGGRARRASSHPVPSRVDCFTTKQSRADHISTSPRRHRATLA